KFESVETKAVEWQYEHRQIRKKFTFNIMGILDTGEKYIERKRYWFETIFKINFINKHPQSAAYYRFVCKCSTNSRWTCCALFDKNHRGWFFMVFLGQRPNSSTVFVF